MTTSSPIKVGKPSSKSSQKVMRVLDINFQSLKSKREEFWSLLEQSEPDIVLGSETWLKPSIAESEVLPPTYKFAARRDRLGSPHGGVAIITKAIINASEIALDGDTEIVAASIPTNQSKPVIVCSIYGPPDNNLEYSLNMCNTILSIQVKFRYHILRIGGDANLPDINWKDGSIEGNQYTRSINSRFIDTFREIGCQQAVNFPTRLDKALDIFASNRPTIINKCSDLPGLSDHDDIMIGTSIIPRTRRPVRRQIYLWSKAHLPGMKRELKEYLQQSCKIQKNWTVTLAPTIEHHGWHSRTPANQRWDQVPGTIEWARNIITDSDQHTMERLQVYMHRCHQ